MAQVVSTPCETSGLAYLPEAALTAIGREDASFPGETLTLIRLEGTELSVKERLQSITGWLPGACEYSVLEQAASIAAWSLIGNTAPLQDEQRTPGILKISLPPASAWDLTRFIDELRGCTWYLDAAGGWLWVGICQAGMTDKIHAISREVNTSGGATTIYRAPSAVKQDTGIYPFPDESIKRLNEKIKTVSTRETSSTPAASMLSFLRALTSFLRRQESSRPTLPYYNAHRIHRRTTD